jgi:uncharacterized membrane protein
MKSKNRALFIDLLRGLALLVMIEVHIFNELLIPQVKEASWFHWVHFINGLVAPSFLFVSGLVFVLSLQNSTQELRKFGTVFWRKINRILLILIAGYALHTPYFSLKKILASQDPEIIKQLFNVDILQVISIGLLILLIARMIFSSDKGYNIFIGSFLLFVLFFSPIAWKMDFNKLLPIPLANFFNQDNGSLFPVFPWFNFLFAGAFISKYFIKARESNTEKTFIRKILYIGIGFYIVSTFCLEVIISPTINVLRPHPFFFLERLGVIFIMLAGCWYYVHNKENYKSVVLDVSRESLLVYWLHLQLIYRKIFDGKSLVDLFGNSLNLLQSTIFTLALCILMIFTAMVWSRAKKKDPWMASRLVLLVIIIGFIAFILRPY